MIRYYANVAITHKTFKNHADLKTVYTQKMMDDIDISQGLISGIRKPSNFTKKLLERSTNRVQKIRHETVLEVALALAMKLSIYKAVLTGP